MFDEIGLQCCDDTNGKDHGMKSMSVSTKALPTLTSQKAENWEIQMAVPMAARRDCDE